MEDFEEAIKQYMIKIVDEDNPNVFKFVWKERAPSYRNVTVDQLKAVKLKSDNICPPGCTKEFIRNVGAYTKGRKVVTPLGEFPSTEQAAKAHEVSPSTVKYRCEHWTKDNFFYKVEND